MRNEIDDNLGGATDENIKYRLGISDFHQTIKSYGKILNSHSILCYDSDSIYFLDKLYITFSSKKKPHVTISSAFFKREQIMVTNHLLLKPNFAHGNNYHYSFAIEYDGYHFGYIHLCNTKNRKVNKIEVDNRILYERPVTYILARFYDISEALDLSFNNISNVEVARDTPNQLYAQISDIHYQSTKCNSTVHRLTGKPARYKPITKAKMEDYVSGNGLTGTFVVGARSSDTTVKIYSKSKELVDNGNKKDYITEIHRKHFGKADSICRVEVTIFSNAFRDTGIFGAFEYNLIDVLLAKNLPFMFFRGLGEKLTYNDLETRKWDAANNDKYERVRLIPKPVSGMIKEKKLRLRKTVNRFSHENRVNKYKFKLLEYLDGDINYWELKRYLYRKRGSQELNMDELTKAYRTVVRNYKNSYVSGKHLRINGLLVSLNKTSKRTKISNAFRRFFSFTS